MKLLIAAMLLLSVAASGQVVGDTLTIQSATPTGAQSISAGAVGEVGTTTLYYFVATRYPSGLVLPGLPIAASNTVGIANLTALNRVQIGWTAANGATGYYVIRGITNDFLASGACTSCVVVANTATIGFSDEGGATTNWPPAGVPFASPARFDTILDNYSEASPYLRTVLNGVAGRLPTVDSGTAPTTGNCAEWAANGTLSDTTGPCAVTAATLTAGSVVFADANGELGQDNANLFWDDTNNRLGLLIAATPLAPVHLNGQLLINGAAALDADVTAVTGAARFATVQDNSAVSVVGSVANAANAVGVELYALKTRAVAPASNANAIVVSGDGILDISGYGADGADYQPAAQILMSVDGTPGVGDMPGRIVFSTTLDGAAALTERARIPNTGGLQMAAVAFASLPAAADGTMVYCSDCDAAAAGAGPTVCASTPGTGAFAFRLNGAWTCLGI